MAQAPGTACRHRGCTEIVHGSYCQAHRIEGRRPSDQAADARRGSARERGYDTRWEHFRAWFLNQPGNQVCAVCMSQCRVTPAELVHHILPVKERPDLRLTASNCQSLCRACHEVIHSKI